MYLIKTDENKILNLEKGDLYRLEKNLLPENCHVKKNDELAVSGGAACLRLWDHLLSLVVFDATKAQAAPQEKPTRFEVGDKVKLKSDGSRAEIIATEWNGRRDRVLIVYEDGANEPRYQQELEPAD